MLIGPTAAHPGGQVNGAEGYTDLLNLKTMKVPSLAFAAAVVCPFRGYNHLYLTCLCRHAIPIYRANVSLGAQKQLTWVQQQVGILSADHLYCRILGGRGVASTSSVVESVCGPTFPIRAFLSSHHFDNDTTARSFCTFMGVFT